MRRLKICLDQSIYEIYKRESTFYLISFKKMFLSLFEFSIISFKKMFCCLFSSFPRNSGKLFEKEILWNLLISVAKKSGKWEYLAIQNIKKHFSHLSLRSPVQDQWLCAAKDSGDPAKEYQTEFELRQQFTSRSQIHQ